MIPLALPTTSITAVAPLEELCGAISEMPSELEKDSNDGRIVINLV